MTPAWELPAIQELKHELTSGIDEISQFQEVME